MDNASIHRKNIIKQLIENTEHEVIFLPPYFPDLNYIEHDFADAPNSGSPQNVRRTKQVL